MQLRSQTEIFPAQPISTCLARGACPSRRERTVPQLCWCELFLVTGSIVCCSTRGWSLLPAPLQQAQQGFGEGLCLAAAGRTQPGTAITLLLPCSSSSAAAAGPPLLTSPLTARPTSDGPRRQRPSWTFRRASLCPWCWVAQARHTPSPLAQAHTQAHANAGWLQRWQGGNRGGG